MTYRVFYGDGLAMISRERDAQERVRSERFSTEHEALIRARELLDRDDGVAVAVCDAAGNELRGVCLQLRLGYARE